MAPPRPFLPGAIPGSSLDELVSVERPDGDLVASQATLSSSLATTNASVGDNKPESAAEINATLPTLPTSARLRTGSPHSRSAGTMQLERRAAMQDRKAILRDLDFRIRESERRRSARQMSSPRLVHSRSVSKGTLTNPGSLSSEAGDKLPLETAAGSRQRGLIEESLPRLMTATLFWLGFRRDVKTWWYYVLQVFVLILAVNNFADGILRLLNTYNAYERWIWPLSVAMSFGQLVAVVYLWGSMQTDIYWSQFVSLNYLPIEVRNEIVAKVERSFKVAVYAQIPFITFLSVLAAGWTVVREWDRLSAVDTYYCLFALTTPWSVGAKVTMSALWQIYVSIQLAVFEWANQTLCTGEETAAKLRTYNLVREQYLRSRRQWGIIATTNILVAIIVVAYCSLAIASGAISEILEGNLYAIDVFMVVMSPLGALEMLTVSAGGLIQLRRGIGDGGWARGGVLV